MWVLLNLNKLLILYLVSVYIDYGLNTSGTFTISFLMAQRRVQAYGIHRSLIFSVVNLGGLPEPLQRVEV